MSICSKTEVYFIDSDKDGVKSVFFTSYERGIESNVIFKKKVSKPPMICKKSSLNHYLLGEEKD